jgi:hypothetical protein
MIPIFGDFWAIFGENIGDFHLDFSFSLPIFGDFGQFLVQYLVSVSLFLAIFGNFRRKYWRFSPGL